MGGRPPGRLPDNGECLLGLDRYQCERDDSYLSTNAAKTITAKTLVMPADTPGGIYRFGYYVPYTCDPRFAVWQGNVDLDGVADVWLRPVQTQVFDDPERVPLNRTRYVTLSPGPHTFAIWHGTLGGTAYIFQSFMEVWRVLPTEEAGPNCPCPCVRDISNDNYNLTTVPQLANRPFVTPELEAGWYRLELSYVVERNSGSALDVNVRRVGVGNVFLTTTREYMWPVDGRSPRTMFCCLELPEGQHTFDMELSSSSVTNVTIHETNWYLHRIV